MSLSNGIGFIDIKVVDVTGDFWGVGRSVVMITRRVDIVFGACDAVGFEFRTRRTNSDWTRFSSDFSKAKVTAHTHMRVTTD